MLAALVIAKLILAVVAFLGGKELGFEEGITASLDMTPPTAWFDCKSFDLDRYNWSHQLGIPHGNPTDSKGL